MYGWAECAYIENIALMPSQFSGGWGTSCTECHLQEVFVRDAHLQCRKHIE